MEERLDEEYRRLLYVAMTRAENRLYIGGYTGYKAPQPESWYYEVEAGIKSHPGTEALPFEKEPEKSLCNSPTRKQGVLTEKGRESRRKSCNSGTGLALPSGAGRASSLVPRAFPACARKPGGGISA